MDYILTVNNLVVYINVISFWLVLGTALSWETEQFLEKTGKWRRRAGVEGVMDAQEQDRNLHSKICGCGVNF